MQKVRILLSRLWKFLLCIFHRFFAMQTVQHSSMHALQDLC